MPIPIGVWEETVLVNVNSNMALEMPLDTDSNCAYLGVKGYHKVY